MPNYFEILHITKDANEAEIKAAYHKLALENHPDKIKQKLQGEMLSSEEIDKKIEEATQKFIVIDEAYKILIDNHERLSYIKKLAEEEMRKSADVYERNKAIFEFFSLFSKSFMEFQKKTLPEEFDVYGLPKTTYHGLDKKYTVPPGQTLFFAVHVKVWPFQRNQLVGYYHNQLLAKEVAAFVDVTHAKKFHGKGGMDLCTEACTDIVIRVSDNLITQAMPREVVHTHLDHEEKNRLSQMQFVIDDELENLEIPKPKIVPAKRR
jgi:curved DNA-binding protein CbpA